MRSCTYNNRGIVWDQRGWHPRRTEHSLCLWSVHTANDHHRSCSHCGWLGVLGAEKAHHGRTSRGEEAGAARRGEDISTRSRDTRASQEKQPLSHRWRYF